MASEHQVALTRSHRMPVPSSHISKAARQVVPAFLQKLYEMVNDPNNQELIRWSEAGDSFFVLDHERFAHEVLGRWFKHRNFSSFVRQLNMYGFHKIPHLQQGVLKSDTETEFWNFAHANFHRGQPDLLCLIQRKKQVPQEDGAIDLRDPATAGIALGGAVPTIGGAVNTSGASVPSGSATLSSGQLLDIHSIVNGITAIKRHQTTISAELNELKRSNQLLWQDALATRGKHQKQQDTINRIVKFLAGVFGHHAGAGGAAGGVSVAAGPPGVAAGQHGKEGGGDGGTGNGQITRRKMRLMIEDAKRDGPRKNVVQELSEIPLDLDTPMYDTNYPSVETPMSAPSPSPSVAASDNISITDNSSYYNNHGHPTSIPESAMSSEHDHTTASSNPAEPTSFSQQQHQQQPQQQHGKQLSRAVTPSRSPSMPMFEFDPRIQGVLNQLTPLQFQHLIASLASQTLTDPNTLDPSHSSSTNTINPNATVTGSHLTPYQPSSFDYSLPPLQHLRTPTTTATTINNNTHPSSSYGPPVPLITPDGLISFDHYDPSSPVATGDVNLNMINDPQSQREHDERMERQWNAAEDIDKDVNALNSSINSLIQTFGLDPSLLDEANMGGGAGGHSSGNNDDEMDGLHLPPPGSGQPGSASSVPADFDFDSFFNNLSSSSSSSGPAGGMNQDGVDYGDLQSTAFLDEVPTPASTSGESTFTASPVQPLRQVSPELVMSGPGGASAGRTAVGRKRKSDVVMEFDGAGAESTKTSTAKAKRRKDK
ncbi:hypothetical protein B0H34DRAFT_739175 [Crassisporium funariophilum]|nr:hypothetical protein B0H34DRAFT_739175 [Crassisporium funariophilum]